MKPIEDVINVIEKQQQIIVNLDTIKSNFDELKRYILKNQEIISPEKVVEYVLENHYDEVREAVFEQEAENQRE